MRTKKPRDCDSAELVEVNPGALKVSNSIRLSHFAREFAPARRCQTGCLFEATGEVALVRETAVGRDLRQILLARLERFFRRRDLALEQVMLGRQAEQVGEAAVEMERAQM